MMGGFGSALLEMANENGINASHVRRLGIPDRFVEHGDRGELLDEIQLSRRGIVDACREMFDKQKNGVSSQQGENSDLHPHQAG